MNVLWCEKCKSIPEKQQRTLWRCWRKQVQTGTISTVKRVLCRHNLKGRSARKKPLLQNCHKKARLWFATAHGDKDCTFLRNVLWSDETKTELFGHSFDSPACLPTCVWPLPACYHDSCLLRRQNKHLPCSARESTPFSPRVFITHTHF